MRRLIFAFSLFVIVILIVLSIWDIARLDLARSYAIEDFALPEDQTELLKVGLLAQIRAADWAFWSMVVAGASAGLTVLSILVAGRFAFQQVRISRDALETTDRAFVEFDAYDWRSHRDGPGSPVFWAFHIRWTNDGNTPAQKLRANFGTFRGEGFDEKTAFQGLLDGEGSAPSRSLRSHGTIKNTPFMITQDDLKWMSENRWQFYVFGRATYYDVFDGTPKHQTTFCIQFVGFTGDPSQDWDAATNPVTFLTPDHGNFNVSS